MKTIIQVRVDSELKDQVSEIFEAIGIDIPTAVRMFFKATVQEKDLPWRVRKDITFEELKTMIDKYLKGENYVY